MPRSTCAPASFDRADQRGAERQHAVAVARSAFREQHDRRAAGQALDDLADGFAGLVAARAVDEHRALEPRGDADQRPARHFALGDEGYRRDRADHQDIGPGHVVGHEQHRAVAHRLADHADANAQQPAQHAVIADGDHAPAGQFELVEQPLHRDQQRRHGEEERRDQKPAQHDFNRSSPRKRGPRAANRN